MEWIIGLISLVVLGFAIYGFNMMCEKHKGNILWLDDLQDLEDLEGELRPYIRKDFNGLNRENIIHCALAISRKELNEDKEKSRIVGCLKNSLVKRKKEL
jgi:hypothetical protein